MGRAAVVSVLCQVKLCAPQSAFINICRWPSALTKVCMSSRQIFGYVVQVQVHVDHILFDDNLFERTLASQPQLELMMSFVCLWYNGMYTFLRSWVIQSRMHIYISATFRFKFPVACLGRVNKIFCGVKKSTRLTPSNETMC